jgi:hypothetical protein
MQVDPNNRLVADALEADWNDKLRAQAAAQEHYEQQRQNDRMTLDDTTRQKVLALAQDLPRLWRDPATRDQDRKRMARLLIEDVTLTKAEQIIAQIRFKGGATRTLKLPRPLSAWKERKTHPDVIHQIDQLLDTCTEDQIAAELNRRGLRSGMKLLFTPDIIVRLRREHVLKPRYDRLRERGLLTADEMAGELGVIRQTVAVWYRHGLLKGYDYNRKGERLYELPSQECRPKKQQGLWGKLTNRAQYSPFQSHAANEVQHEA